MTETILIRELTLVPLKWSPLSDLTILAIPCSLKICLVKSATHLLLLCPLGIFLENGYLV